MVAIGSLMVLIVLLGLYFLRNQQYEQKNWYLKALLWSIPLPYIANTTGWFIAETGRQPWIVYGLQKTAAGVSTVVPAGQVLTTLIGFTLIYGVVAVADVYLLVKYIKKGPDETAAESAENVAKGASLWT